VYKQCNVNRTGTIIVGSAVCWNIPNYTETRQGLNHVWAAILYCQSSTSFPAYKHRENRRVDKNVSGYTGSSVSTNIITTVACCVITGRQHNEHNRRSWGWGVPPVWGPELRHNKAHFTTSSFNCSSRLFGPFLYLKQTDTADRRVRIPIYAFKRHIDRRWWQQVWQKNELKKQFYSQCKYNNYMM
jgi:hypothetical protein